MYTKTGPSLHINLLGRVHPAGIFGSRSRSRVKLLTDHPLDLGLDAFDPLGFDLREHRPDQFGQSIGRDRGGSADQQSTKLATPTPEGRHDDQTATDYPLHDAHRRSPLSKRAIRATKPTHAATR